MILAITGGIGCGKSEVLKVLANKGWEVLDADDVAHNILSDPDFIQNVIIPKFGKNVLNGNVINRKKLGQIVFSDKTLLDYLNSYMHPPIMEIIDVWISTLKESGIDGAVAIPLLFETGWLGDWDYVICISSDENIVRERLYKRNLSDAQIDSRISNQMALSEKEKLSDIVIKNNSDIAALQEEIDKMVRCLDEIV